MQEGGPGPDRVVDKDALDAYRLLQAVETVEIARRFGVLLSNPFARTVTEQALEALPELFGSSRGPGVAMLSRTLGPLEGGATPEASVVALTWDLLEELKMSR